MVRVRGIRMTVVVVVVGLELQVLVLVDSSRSALERRLVVEWGIAGRLP